MKKKDFLVGGLMLVLLMVLVTVGCTKRALQNNTEETSNTANEITNTANEIANNTVNENATGSGLADPDIAATLATSELNRATELTKAIQKDVVLAAISTKYINSLSDESGLSTNYYIFISPTKPDYYFLVNMPRNATEQPKRFIMLQQDFSDLGFSILPVPYEYWKINYAKALQLAEQAGGAKFRTGHKNFEVSEILARPSGGSGESYHLQWHIAYKAKDDISTMFKVQVHANTGAVTLIP